MHRMTGFAALLASVLVAAAPLAVAVAQPANQPAKPPANAPGNPPPPDPKEALAAFGKAKITLTDAVAAGEQQGGGGRRCDLAAAAATRLSRHDLSYIREYHEPIPETDRPGQHDPESKLMTVRRPSGRNRSGEDDAGPGHKAAEQQGGGKAIDAGIEQRGGKMSYEIAIVKSGAVQPMTVDPTTGTATVATTPPDSPKQ